MPVSVRRPDLLHVGLRDAALELLAVELAVAVHLGDEPLESAFTTETPTPCEAAGDLVALAAELAARVQLRQHDRQRRQALVSLTTSTGIPRPWSATVTELSGWR